LRKAILISVPKLTEIRETVNLIRGSMMFRGDIFFPGHGQAPSSLTHIMMQLLEGIISLLKVGNPI